MAITVTIVDGDSITVSGITLPQTVKVDNVVSNAPVVNAEVISGVEGPKGDTGDTGPTGAASTVPGPIGVTG